MKKKKRKPVNLDAIDDAPADDNGNWHGLLLKIVMQCSIYMWSLMILYCLFLS